MGCEIMGLEVHINFQGHRATVELKEDKEKWEIGFE